MRYTVLSNPFQRAWGAMFKRALGDEILIFVYPRPSKRQFHTASCPPLQIAALGEDGKVIFCQNVKPGQIVSLPSTRLVVESDPGVKIPHEEILRHLKQIKALDNADYMQEGGIEENATIASLLFAALLDAFRDLRSAKDMMLGLTLNADTLRSKFEPWRRGRLAASAGFVLDMVSEYQMPGGAIKLARAILDAESENMGEILAAAIAGVPWKKQFPTLCPSCGRKASWRMVIEPPEIPSDKNWRYDRPENHVLLCNKCASGTGFNANVDVRERLARLLWGDRFRAFKKWHVSKPDNFDLANYPLWPPSCGGRTWEKGSGALEFCEPSAPLSFVAMVAGVEREHRTHLRTRKALPPAKYDKVHETFSARR